MSKIAPDHLRRQAFVYQPVAKVGDSGSTRSVEFRTLDRHCCPTRAI